MINLKGNQIVIRDQSRKVDPRKTFKIKLIKEFKKEPTKTNRKKMLNL